MHTQFSSTVGGKKAAFEWLSLSSLIVALHVCHRHQLDTATSSGEGTSARLRMRSSEDFCPGDFRRPHRRVKAPAPTQATYMNNKSRTRNRCTQYLLCQRGF